MDHLRVGGSAGDGGYDNNVSQDYASSDTDNDSNNDHLTFFDHNLFNDFYLNLSTMVVPKGFGLKRTYELPFRTYYFVMTPLNRPYEQNKDNFVNDIPKIERFLRDKFKYHRIFITREIMNCAKIHYNILLTTKVNLSDENKYHNGTIFNHKYSICAPRELYGAGQIEVVYKYMIKESKKRPMLQSIDRLIYQKV